MAAPAAVRNFAVEFSLAGENVSISGGSDGAIKSRPLYFDNQATTPTDPR